MRIIVSYKVPEGNVSPDIFKLPCVSSAYKNIHGATCYHVGEEIAATNDWICKYENGRWRVLLNWEYQQTKSSQNLTKSSQ